MNKGLTLGLVLTLFICSSAIAGPANLEGSWSGTATSIVCCPNPVLTEPPICQTIEIGATAYILMQTGNLFWGYFEAENYEHPCWETIIDQSALLTGTISIDKQISGTIGVPGDLNNFQGIGMFEGKWSGKKMKAVLRDFSDGSTTIGVFTKD